MASRQSSSPNSSRLSKISQCPRSLLLPPSLTIYSRNRRLLTHRRCPSTYQPRQSVHRERFLLSLLTPALPQKRSTSSPHVSNLYSLSYQAISGLFFLHPGDRNLPLIWLLSFLRHRSLRHLVALSNDKRFGFHVPPAVGGTIYAQKVSLRPVSLISIHFHGFLLWTNPFLWQETPGTPIS